MTMTIMLSRVGLTVNSQIWMENAIIIFRYANINQEIGKFMAVHYVNVFQTTYILHYLSIYQKKTLIKITR